MDVQSFYRSSSLNQTPRDGVAFQTLSLSLPQFSLSLSLSLSHQQQVSSQPNPFEGIIIPPTAMTGGFGDLPGPDPEDTPRKEVGITLFQRRKRCFLSL
jgi:hypothetical protein